MYINLACPSGVGFFFFLIFVHHCNHQESNKLYPTINQQAEIQDLCVSLIPAEEGIFQPLVRSNIIDSPLPGLRIRRP